MDFGSIAMAPTVKPYADGQDHTGQTLEEAFPVADCEFRPFGSKIVVQVRRVMTRSKGGIILGTESKETEAWNTQTGKIVAMGPLAFKNRQTGQAWPEGMWANLGDFVRFPRHMGDRLSVPMEDGGEPVVFLVMEDHNLTGAYTGNPLKPRAFIQ